jgi:hypothetical protein
VSVGHSDGPFVEAGECGYVGALLECGVGSHLLDECLISIDSPWNTHSCFGILRDFPNEFVNSMNRDLT